MTITLPTENANIYIADFYFPKKHTNEAKVFAEILNQKQTKEHVYYIESYNTIPQKLGISKDAYRRAMSNIKKKGLIGKHGFTITLSNKQLLIKTSQVNIKQI